MTDLFIAPLYLLAVLRTPGRSLVEEFHDKAAMRDRARALVQEPHIAYVTLNVRGNPPRQTHRAFMKDDVLVIMPTDPAIERRAKKPRKMQASKFAGLG